MTRYLVIQLARFGDLIQTKRLLLSLAAEGAAVHLAVDRSLAKLAGILYPGVTIHPLAAHGTHSDAADVLAANAVSFAGLRETGFTAIYALNYSPLTFALAALFEPDMVHGYRRAKGQDLRSRWTRTAFRWTRERRGSPLNLVDFWGFFAERPLAPESVNPEATPRGSGRIGIVLAGRESRRSLPPDTLAPCVEGIFAAMDGPRLALIGSKAERPLARRLVRCFPPALAQKVDDFTGKTALTDLPELFDGFDAVLTPDTGAMHLAAHLGVPVRAFFLSSAWAFETGPYGRGHRIWQAVRPCAPCVESTPCPYDTACLSPFRERAFVRSLAGKESGGWAADLVELEPYFDALGQNYRVKKGEIPGDGARLEQREALAALRGLEAGTFCDSAFERIVHERDWVLPDF